MMATKSQSCQGTVYISINRTMKEYNGREAGGGEESKPVRTDEGALILF